MLDLKFIRNNPDVVREAVRVKKFTVDIDRLLELDSRKRQLQQDIEDLRRERNTLSNQVKSASNDERPALIAASREVGQKLSAAEKGLGPVSAELDELLALVPGIPEPEVPVGDGEEDNVVLRHWGTPREYDFEPKSHIELLKLHDMVDFERPPKFAGSRAVALKGDAVLLEQAVLRYALDICNADGFVPVSPPVLVNERAMFGTSFFPLGRDDAYHMEKDDLFLVGTSEVSLVSLHAGELMEPDALPIRYAGISPCFRREAGAAGRDTKGLYRVHQFNKVEQVVFCVADNEVSLQEHMRLLNNSEKVLQGLGLPYRVAAACTQELGVGQVRKHEVETWMNSRNAYCETHSCSTFHTYQSRRSNIRYRPAKGEKPLFTHTLNNTAIASPRILIPILEHYQNEDGSITIPEVLRPYMNGREKIG